MTIGIDAETPPLTTLKKPFTAPFASSSTPAMLFLPIASSVPVTPLVTEFDMFWMLVWTPPAAVSAWSLKDAKLAPPCVSSSTILSMSWSSVMVGSLPPPPSAAYRSLAFAVGPSMDFASWSIWPGAAVVSERQSSISGLPLERIWRNCSIAAEHSWVELPEAMSMSLSARPTSVALSRSPTVAVMPWTTETMSSSLVGKVDRRSDILPIDALAESAEYPRDCMTFG